MKPSILAIDDEADLLKTYELILKNKFTVLTARSGQAGLEIIKEKNPEVILLDIRMPDWNGIETLQKIKHYDPELDVIMVTASQELRTAVDTMKRGAYDFIVKPFDVDELIQVINNALEKRRLLKENLYLKESLKESSRYQKLVGHSRALGKVLNTIETIANTKSTVLITGESGTGKELIAHAIHDLSSRAPHPFVVVNCAAIPDNLFESILFGHEAGSFTGANSRRTGKFELADSGTIFLDEIGCLPYAMQSKLLRVLQESQIERVGSSNPIKINVRVIVATNANLAELAKQKIFREDLFFRLNVIPIYSPPLRHRKEDLPLLVEHFIKKYNLELNKNVKGLTREAMAKLINYDWPGNVRELQNIIERAVVLAKNGILDARQLNLGSGTEENNFSNFHLACQSFEKELIEKTLAKTGGNQSQAAKILGIHRTTLISKMKVLKVTA